MDEKNHEAWKYLIEKYFSGAILPAELDALLAMTRDSGDDVPLSDALRAQWEKSMQHGQHSSVDWDGKLEAMLARKEAPVVAIPPVKKQIPIHRLRAAVIFLLAVSGIAYYISREKPGPQTLAATTSAAPHTDLRPGADGAVLTLADGSQIVLDSLQNGTVLFQGATRVLNNNGRICYDKNESSLPVALFNTLRTPKGKQYQLELSDGTKVWLNAASSIRFPAVFTRGERRVEITGEVYFEVAHRSFKDRQGRSARLPFIVGFNSGTEKSGEVQVMGTHFNVDAYDDEGAVKATLLEGSVKIRSLSGDSTLLTPGEQAIVKASGVHVTRNIDPGAIVAWKNGYFSFSHTDLATVMRQIARWYDVEVDYEGKIPDRKFGGEISRNSNALDVLKILEESSVHFRIEGKKITVLP